MKIIKYIGIIADWLFIFFAIVWGAIFIHNYFHVHKVLCLRNESIYGINRIITECHGSTEICEDALKDIPQVCNIPGWHHEKD